MSHDTELALLDRLEIEARRLPKGKEWKAFDESRGYEDMEVHKQLTWRRDRGEPLSFAITMERSRIERAKAQDLFHEQHALANELSAVPDWILSTGEDDWRCRLLSRQLTSMGHARWGRDEWNRARDIVDRHKQATEGK